MLDMITSPIGQFFVSIVFIVGNTESQVYTYLTSRVLEAGDIISTFNGKRMLVKSTATCIQREAWMQERGFSVLEEQECITEVIKPQYVAPKGTEFVKMENHEGKKFWYLTTLKFEIGQTILTKTGSRFKILNKAKGIQKTEIRKLVVFEEQFGKFFRLVDESQLNGFTLKQKIIVKKPRKLEGTMIITPGSNLWETLAVKDFPEKIAIRGYKTLTEAMLSKLAKMHLYGAIIGIFANGKWEVFNKVKNPKERFDLIGENLAAEELPKELLEMVSPVSKRNFLELMNMSNNKGAYTPPEAFELIKAYNKRLIEETYRENSKTDFTVWNNFLKEVFERVGQSMETMVPNCLKEEVICGKISEVSLTEEGEPILDDKQRTEFQIWAPAFGYKYEDCLRYRHEDCKKVDDRWATWEDEMLVPLSEGEKAYASYDPKKENLPKWVRNKYLGVRVFINYQKEFELYQCVEYLKSFGRKFLDPDWSICKKHGPYLTEQGCELCCKKAKFTKVPYQDYMVGTYDKIDE